MTRKVNSGWKKETEMQLASKVRTVRTASTRKADSGRKKRGRTQTPEQGKDTVNRSRKTDSGRKKETANQLQNNVRTLSTRLGKRTAAERKRLNTNCSPI